MILNNVLNSMLSKISVDQSKAIMFPIFEEFKFNHSVDELDSMELDTSVDSPNYFSLLQVIKMLTDP